jgi:hypothetical protein
MMSSASDTVHIYLDDEVLDLAEAAQFLKMSEAWVEKSDIPRLRFGRAVRYLRSQLLAYATTHATHLIRSENGEQRTAKRDLP